MTGTAYASPPPPQPGQAPSPNNLTSIPEEKQQAKSGLGSRLAPKLNKLGSAMTTELASLDLRDPSQQRSGPHMRGVPEQGQFTGAQSTESASDDVGTFNGGAFRVSHRDTNSILTLQLAMGCPITAKPGAMIAMSPSVSLKGAVKFSVKKLFGGEMSNSVFTGPGELLLAPPVLGDIHLLRMTNESPSWSVGRDAFLASTQGITRDIKGQGISKAIFSGEGLFVYRITGSGICWLSTFGAIIKKEVRSNHTHIANSDSVRCSSWKAKSISLTTAISLRGIASTYWNAPHPGASSPVQPPAKVSSASSPDRGQYTCRLATPRHSRRTWRLRQCTHYKKPLDMCDQTQHLLALVLRSFTTIGRNRTRNGAYPRGKPSTQRDSDPRKIDRLCVHQQGQ